MRRTASRGFTLVELLVAMVVTLVVVTMALVAMQSQQRAYHGGQRLREAQDANRRAALAIEQALRHAGLGMDPSLALDFGIYGNPALEPLPDASLCPAGMACFPRDSATDADELVFYARNPAFRVADPDPVGRAWALLNVTSGTARLRAKAGDVFLPGQILLAICRDPNKYAYFTVAQRTPSPVAAGGDPAPLDVPLAPQRNEDPFRRQDVADQTLPNAETCFQSAYAFEIDRYRFHVRPVQAAGGRWEPYLVLDTGVDRNGDGAVNANDEVLVASGVEMIQFAYLFQNGTIAGATPGTPIQFPSATAGPPATFGDTRPDVVTATSFPLSAPDADKSIYFPSSWFPIAQDAAARQTNAQGNIRAIRVGIVSRSRSPYPDGHANLIVGPGFTLENFQGSTSAPAWLTAGRPADGDDRYVRSRLEITIPVPNLRIRAMALN